MKAEYDFSKGKRGAVIPQKGKTRISIFIDNAVLDGFRARAERAGTGYQTMMNEALRQYLSESDHPVTEKALRQILRQEMPEYLRSPKPRSAATLRKRAARSVQANAVRKKVAALKITDADIATAVKRARKQKS